MTREGTRRSSRADATELQRALEQERKRAVAEAERDRHDVTDLVRLRRAAEESEERFRLALAAADLGTWDCDPEAGTFSCDDRFRQLFGVGPGGELSGARMKSAIHPEDQARVQAAVDRSFDPASGGGYSVEYRTVGLEDGIERWLSLRGRTFFDTTGRPSRFTGAALEITEQVRAQERLRDAQRDTTMLADAVPQILWTSDTDGFVDFYNRRWYEYTGLPLGRLGSSQWEAVVHPDDLAEIHERWRRSLEKGEPFELEVRLLRAADRSYRWHLVQSVPVRDARGKVAKWVGCSADIDDRKRVEEITRFLGDASAVLASSLDSEATLRTLGKLVVPRMADWCVITYTNGDDLAQAKNFVAHKDASKVSWAEALIEKYPIDMTAPFGVPQVVRTGKPELYSDIPEELIVAAAQDETHLEILRALGMRSLMIVPITARGRTFGVITYASAESGRRYETADLVIAQSLGERAAHAIDNARLYAEAQEAVRVRDEFISIASHELKTPLTPLHLQLQALQNKKDEPLPEKVVRRLDVMGRQVDRLERLVRTLVDISRITGRRFDLEREPVDLGDVVREVAERFSGELDRARCALTLELEDGAVGLWDRLRVEQIVFNLLSNAIKFGAGHPVEVRVSSEDGVAKLTLEDHGIGIDAADQARIFERFERAVPTRHYGGFGLGLWIVRQIAEALGGSVSVESDLGRGSRFTVLLPQLPPPQITTLEARPQ